MKLRIGMPLIARKTVYIYNRKDIAIIKNKPYIIKDLIENYFIIDSEIGNNHYWGKEEAEKYFKINNICLNKNIHIL